MSNYGIHPIDANTVKYIAEAAKDVLDDTTPVSPYRNLDIRKISISSVNQSNVIVSFSRARARARIPKRDTESDGAVRARERAARGRLVSTMKPPCNRGYVGAPSVARDLSAHGGGPAVCRRARRDSWQWVWVAFTRFRWTRPNPMT